MNIYDKAKFHSEQCASEGLPEEHAYMHTAVFICWAAENGMLDLNQFDGDQGATERIKQRVGKPTDLYEDLDGVFVSDMLTPEGVKFADAYFDFENGLYIRDYTAYLASGLKNEYHVPVTWESYEVMVPVIQARYVDFVGKGLNMPPKRKPQAARPWWKFW